MTQETQQSSKPQSVGGASRYQAGDFQRAVWRTKGQRALGFGVVWLISGLIVTVVTYEQAVQAGGGVYLIAYGPVLYGIYRIIRGIFFLHRTQ